MERRTKWLRGLIFMKPTTGIVSICLTMLLACTGEIGHRQGNDGRSGPPGGGPGSTSGGGGSGSGLPGTGSCQEVAPLMSAARRLTRAQYANALRDLRLDTKGADQLPADDGGDDVVADPRSMIVTPTWASSAMSAAEMAAKTAVANLSTLSPCSPASDESACARQFMAAFGRRAYRRPLETAEVDGLMKVYAIGAQSGGFAHGIEVAIRTMLQAPSFLYILELGQPAGSTGNAVRLGPYEVASRLSYLMWNTLPDDVLFTAAASDKLSTREQIDEQARRMIADEKAQAPLVAFHGKWLGFDGLGGASKDPGKYPEFDDHLAKAMQTELDLYLKDVLFKGDGRLESLFESRFTYVDASLAPLYGVAPPPSGFARVDLDSRQRAGILANIGVIAAHTFADESEPIHRGKFVRERLLCTSLPDPPPDLMVTPPTPKPGVTIRERLIEHSSVAGCQACHEMMDPIGFGFEAYDGLGRFRTTDPSGKPIDDNGTLGMTKDVDGPFKGVIELGQKLAESNQVRDCVLSTMTRYARGPEADSDACVHQKLGAAFERGHHDLKEVLVALTQTDGFLYRRKIEGEVLQ
jgi:hypothetical protein